jgi:hypothetical protein
MKINVSEKRNGVSIMKINIESQRSKIMYQRRIIMAYRSANEKYQWRKWRMKAVMAKNNVIMAKA